MSRKPRATLERRLRQAAAHHEAGRLEDAEKAYLAILSAVPEQAEAIQRLGIIALQTERFGRAAGYLRQCLRLMPDDPHSPYYLAMALASSGDKPAAIKLLETLLERAPNFTEANKLLAELQLSGLHYTEVLSRLHAWLQPAAYVEIGVETGRTLALARPPTACVGIDPAPCISHSFAAPTRVFARTSEAFFATEDLHAALDGQPLDMAFIDGMHTFDAALRDFINLERHARKDTVILFHDCLPLNAITSRRERVTEFWSGDTWKVIPCLMRYRPDLRIFTIPAAPTGLGVVTGLDPSSTILSQRFDEIVAEFMPLDCDWLGSDKHRRLGVHGQTWDQIRQRLEDCRAQSV